MYIYIINYIHSIYFLYYILNSLKPIYHKTTVLYKSSHNKCHIFPCQISCQQWLSRWLMFILNSSYNDRRDVQVYIYIPIVFTIRHTVEQYHPPPLPLYPIGTQDQAPPTPHHLYPQRVKNLTFDNKSKATVFYITSFFELYNVGYIEINCW